MIAGRIGYLDTPSQGNKRPPGVTWAADNGCFGKGYPGDVAWIEWLTANKRDATRCLFATAPDVVGDAVATLARSVPFLQTIRELGYPAALVAQNGLEALPAPWAIPWDAFDVLFIGGDTAWKLGPHARRLVAEAKRRGKDVHMGRVNSGRRLRYAAWIDCDSVDGTFLTFGPDQNLARLTRWLDDLVDKPALPLDLSA
ncbi:hypothetical protein [Nocardia salmonicida]|uniref:hypothetical protein n=1 Tax=Nocardia salmonicida TaxID=53431 RepID=UPI0036426A93